MKKIITTILIAILCFSCSSGDKKVIAGYLPLWKLWDITRMDGLTHAHLSFAKVGSDNKAYIDDYPQYRNNLEKIPLIKEKYPDLKLTIAVGGYGVDGFSDMALTKEGRDAFSISLMEIVKKYNLDGVDVDWEFPGHDGWGTITAREEDKQNFTLLLKELRSGLDRLKRETGKSYELSFAAAAQTWGYNNIEVEDVFNIVDYMNLMAYDFIGNWSPTTGHHSNLYLNPASAAMDTSINKSVIEYINRGAVREKIIIGIPLYAYGWEGVEPLENGLFQSVSAPISGFIDYSTLRRDYVDNGYSEHWDDISKVPYLYNGDKFITFDNKRSVKYKLKYIEDKNLAGMMIWEYTQDDRNELLDIVKKEFN